MTPMMHPSVSATPAPEWLPREMLSLWEAFATDPMIGVWAVDAADLRVIYADDAAAAMILRSSPDAVVGLSVREHAPELVAARLTRLLEQAVADRTPIVGQAVWQGRRLRSTFSPLLGENGEVERILIVTRPAPAQSPAAEALVVDEAEYCHLGGLDRLTTRELEVLAYLGSGLSIEETAQRIRRSTHTVRRFREKIGVKLGVRDRCELICLVRDAGLRPEHAYLRRIAMEN